MTLAISSSNKLSHLIGAPKVVYDFESIDSLFSCVFIKQDWIGLWVFADEEYDDVSDDDLWDMVAAFVRGSEQFRDDTDMDKLTLSVDRFHTGDRDSIKRFAREMNKLIMCEPLSIDPDQSPELVEYYGWNSQHYDLRLAILSYLALNLGTCGDHALPTPKDIRFLSDTIIGFKGRPWEWFDYVTASTRGTDFPIHGAVFKALENKAIYRDGHIDIAALIRQDASGDDALFPPNLKREMARFGMDVVIDDVVAGWHETLDKAALAKLISYNCNDVFGTKRIGDNKVVQGALQTRDIVKSMYPYASARSMPESKLSKYTPLGRDCTTASLAGTVLIGEKRIKPTDWKVVMYGFPIVENGRTRFIDLLEYAKQLEGDSFDDVAYRFFDYWRGKDTTTKWQVYHLTKQQPITHSPTVTVPYRRNGKPTDAYATLSTGGAHGGVYAGLSALDEDAIAAWIRSGGKVKDTDVPTLDLVRIVHADFASYYPTLSSKMRIYLTSEGVDRYTSIIDYRVKIKESLPYDKTELTPEQAALQEQQLGLKLILNSATGAGNMHQKYAPLPVDNKTQSMRLVGNILIYVLGQRFTEAGGFVVSTNTDGLYVANLSMEEASAIIDKFTSDYGIAIDPEPVERFINRDTSNRVEIVGDHIKEVRGRLRHGRVPHFTDYSVGYPIPYPLVCAYAALQYMLTDPDWLKKPYDGNRLRAILDDTLENDFDPLGWVHIWSGTSKSRLIVDGKPAQKINRLVLTKGGRKISHERARKLPNDVAQEFYVAAREAVANGETDAGKVAESLGIELHSTCAVCDLSTIGFGHKEVNEQRVEIVVRDEPHEFAEKLTADPEDGDGLKLSNVMAMTGSSFLTLTAANGEVLVVEAWQPTKLTGYTSNVVDVLNMADEVKHFNKNRLDVDAYQRWAENLLQSWKVTADMPDVGMVSVDDAVVAGKEKKSDDAAEVETLKGWLFTTLKSKLSRD